MKKERMNVLFSLVPKSDIIADVGCDHGYLTNMLAQSNKANLVIASDVSSPSLDKAKNNFEEEKAKINVKFIVSNGFENYGQYLPDCVVIAGMGGYEIIKILSNYSIENIQNIILQPMKDLPLLRQFLSKYFIIEKDFIKEIKGKFYTFIKAKKGREELSKESILIGKTNYFDAPLDFFKFLDYNIGNLNCYMDNAKSSSSFSKLKTQISFYKEIKEKYYGKNVSIPKS